MPPRRREIALATCRDVHVLRDALCAEHCDATGQDRSLWCRIVSNASSSSTLSYGQLLVQGSCVALTIWLLLFLMCIKCSGCYFSNVSYPRGAARFRRLASVPPYVAGVGVFDIIGTAVAGRLSGQDKNMTTIASLNRQEVPRLSAQHRFSCSRITTQKYACSTALRQKCHSTTSC